MTLKANADAFAERVLPMIADAQRRGHTRAIAAEFERLYVKTARWLDLGPEAGGEHTEASAL